ncbi:MAG: Prophage LambdaBa04, site-specific recombinase, phage integrase family, partial [uncultured Rubrobacteraceae bacterium]
ALPSPRAEDLHRSLAPGLDVLRAARAPRPPDGADHDTGRPPPRGGARVHQRGRHAHQPDQPQEAVFRLTPPEGEGATCALPRPQAHLRHAALLAQRPPEGRTGTPRALQHLHHARHLLPRHTGHGGPGGQGDRGHPVL